MKRKKKPIAAPHNRIFLSFLLLGAIAAILSTVLLFWPTGEKPSASTAEDHRAPAYLPEEGSGFTLSVRPDKDEVQPSSSPNAIARKGGVVALIIDDAGNDLAALDHFLRFPGKLSVAVLPQLPHSRESAERAHAAGKEVILHLPLEPLGNENPGPGAVLVSYDRNRIRDILDRDFESVPFAKGVNNHMGSLATQDRGVMDVLLSYLKEKGRYFIDSRTVSSTLGREYAEHYAVPTADRNFFLDNSSERTAILRSLNDGVTYARLHGHALLIGHVQHRALLDLLVEEYGGLVSSGIEFVTVSEYLRLKGGAAQ